MGPQVVAVKGAAAQLSSVHIEADATPSATEAPADKGPSTRTNFDKRCSRQRNAPHFRKAIESFRCNPALTDESLLPATASSLQVHIRKRPLLVHEEEADMF